MYVKQAIAAGQRLEFTEAADFFRILNAQAPLNLTIYRAGAEIGEALEVSTGYAEAVAQGFDKIAITSTVAQTIQFVMRQGADVRYDQPPTGAVTVSNVNGAFTQTTKTVTSSSGQLLAENALRRYLLVQNNASSGDIYIRVDGATATAANGIKIAAGQALEMSAFVPTAAITAIGSVASNPSIVIAEG